MRWPVIDVFALLPPDNATGNFTKVVQRIPVRIKFHATSAPEGPGDAETLRRERPGRRAGH